MRTLETVGTRAAMLESFSFELPRELEAAAPPEARGLPRDAVRLMVSYTSDDHVVHAGFRDLPCFLEAGDLVVLNTSATLAAAVPAQRADGSRLTVHLSTRLPAGLWLVELREPAAIATAPFRENMSGERLALPDGGQITLYSDYGGQRRLWIASLCLPGLLHDYLARFGKPIRYNYVPREWPLDYYQTVYATEPGSAEMPSAGRAFTPEIITRLVAGGVQVAPLVLHTGVASLEEHEPPYEEYYRVPPATAQLVNLARENGRRVIAVGTTVVRALETVADKRGRVQAGAGWTTLVITPERGVRVVDGLLTGFHEPRATHLAMLEAISSRKHLRVAYREALQARYFWHEFGDLHLLLR